MVDEQSNKLRKADELNTEKRAGMLGFTYLNLTNHTITKESIEGILPKQMVEETKAVPLRREGQRLFVGITLSTPKTKLEELLKFFDSFNVQFVVISDSSYLDIYNLLFPKQKVVVGDIDLTKADALKESRLPEEFFSLNGDEMLLYLLNQAVSLRVTDIHLETAQDGSRIRFRVDGVLYSVAKLSKDRYRLLEGAIAIRADIGVASNATQTGHMSLDFTIDGEQKKISARLETVPTLNGQDLVLRLFNLDPALLELNNLGIRNKVKELLESIIDKPKGLLLISGPTGSGKTTTLYALLRRLNTEQRKIVTLENPVEAPFDGVTQISVDGEHEGAFADTLRSVLRLDPDVIMVGEIRDVDTAKTAIHAALTGHLVLATFHASDAASAIERIYDMVDHNPLFSSAIRAVVSQRLIRNIGPDAEKHFYRPEGKVLDFLATHGGGDRDFVAGSEIVSAPDLEDAMHFYEGRSIIAEAFEVEDSFATMLDDGGAHLAATIRSNYFKDARLTLIEDGVRRVMDGHTTFEEIMRVID